MDENFIEPACGHVTATVAIDNISFCADKPYSYSVPEKFAEQIKVGCRVIVPFGRGSKLTGAVVLEVDSSFDTSKLKSVSEIVDEENVVSRSMLNLALYMKKKYFCTVYDAVKLMIPTGMSTKISYRYFINASADLNKNNFSKKENFIIDFLSRLSEPCTKKLISESAGFEADKVLKGLVKKGILQERSTCSQKVADATMKMVKIKNFDPTCVKITAKQKLVVDFLADKKDGLCVKEILYHTGVGASVVEALVKKGVAEYFFEEVFRDPYKKNVAINFDDIVLNDEQNKAFCNIYSDYKRDEYRVSLLYGITGSGKTSVFMKLIDSVQKNGDGIIVMVPEIALTSQIISIFKARFGNRVAVFHSRLSQGERLDEYKRVKNGDATIVVGTRSAVFAPVRNLGLIIIDEEQESSYKSDKTPRYHARDIAKYRCCEKKALLLLSSATPSVESFYMADKSKYSLNKLTKRYGNAVLPSVTVVDMNREIERGNISNFSRVLIDKIEKNIEENRQSILLLNRRGYNTFVSCRNCAEVVTCPGCSIPLTYHSDNHKMMCHYCGYSMDIRDECPHCCQAQLKYSGCGTQKVEEELEQLVNGAKILRMDADTTHAKFSHEKKLKEFRDGKYNIMIGTQMVAKGLDFPNVTLVGVLSADQSLYGSDFRSFERTFSLLTQVVGRAGRAQNPGSAVIQTFTPENPVIDLAAKQNYDRFYNEEIEIRKAMLYPPFANICIIGFAGENERKTLAAAKAFFEEFKKLVVKDYAGLALKVLGPSPAIILKINNKYRYKIIVKFKEEKILRELLFRLVSIAETEKKFGGVKTFIDVNPDTIM